MPLCLRFVFAGRPVSLQASATQHVLTLSIFPMLRLVSTVPAWEACPCDPIPTAVTLPSPPSFSTPLTWSILPMFLLVSTIPDWLAWPVEPRPMKVCAALPLASVSLSKCRTDLSASLAPNVGHSCL